MSAADLRLLVTARSRPGAHGQLRRALLDLAGPSRADVGCLQYELHESDGHFVLLETWTDQDALDAHLASPHSAAFSGHAAALLADPLTVSTLHPLTTTNEPGDHR